MNRNQRILYIQASCKIALNVGCVVYFTLCLIYTVATAPPMATDRLSLFIKNKKNGSGQQANRDSDHINKKLLAQIK